MGPITEMNLQISSATTAFMMAIVVTSPSTCVHNSIVCNDTARFLVCICILISYWGVDICRIYALLLNATLHASWVNYPVMQ